LRGGETGPTTSREEEQIHITKVNAEKDLLKLFLQIVYPQISRSQLAKLITQ
jgi:hypothetical protein